MRQDDVKKYVGKSVLFTFINQRKEQTTFCGVVSVCRNSEVFFRGEFPTRKTSRTYGGIWIPAHDIVSLIVCVKEQEEEKP